MPNIVSQIRIIYKSIPSYPRNAFWKCFWLIIALTLFSIAFHLCNDIPLRTIDINVHTTGPAKTSLSLFTYMGTYTDLNKGMKDGIWSPFHASGKTGLVFHVKTDSSDVLVSDIREDIVTAFQEAYPDDGQIKGLDNLIEVSWQISSPKKGILLNVDRDGVEEVARKEQDNGNICYAKASLDNTQVGELKGSGAFAFTNSTITGIGDWVVEHKRTRAIETFSDISQSYVAIKLNGSQQSGVGKDMKLLKWNDWDFDLVKNPVELIIDFGSSISVSGMEPAPDEVTMTRVIFREPKKIKEIVTSGVVFHIQFPHLENLQSMKLFWITAVITALATWLATIIIKWIKHDYRNRRYLKRKRKEKELSSDMENKANI